MISMDLSLIFKPIKTEDIFYLLLVVLSFSFIIVQKKAKYINK